MKIVENIYREKYKWQYKIIIVYYNNCNLKF